jgi:hypothetical protein
VNKIALKVESIRRKIIKVAGFTLYINAWLPSDRDIVKINKHSDTNSMTLEMMDVAFLNLVCPRTDYNDPYIHVTISAPNQGYFVDKMEEILDVLERDDIYYFESGVLKMFAPLPDDATVQFKIKDDFIQFRPAIISMSEGKITYEAIEITINKSAFTYYLSYTEFKTLKRAIDRTDIFMYSQLLLNFLGKKTVMNIPVENKEDIERATRIIEDNLLPKIDKPSLSEADKERYLKLVAKEKENKMKRNSMNSVIMEKKKEELLRAKKKEEDKDG